MAARFSAREWMMDKLVSVYYPVNAGACRSFVQHLEEGLYDSELTRAQKVAVLRSANSY